MVRQEILVSREGGGEGERHRYQWDQWDGIVGLRDLLSDMSLKKLDSELLFEKLILKSIVTLNY